MPACIQLAIRSISCSPIPRVVAAGVPIRIPEGSSGVRGSNGTVLQLVVIRARSSAWSRSCREGPWSSDRPGSGGCRCRPKRGRSPAPTARRPAPWHWRPSAGRSPRTAGRAPYRGRPRSPPWCGCAVRPEGPGRSRRCAAPPIRDHSRAHHYLQLMRPDAPFGNRWRTLVRPGRV